MMQNGVFVCAVPRSDSAFEWWDTWRSKGPQQKQAHAVTSVLALVVL